ncbi:neuropeptide Y [Elysia marginata]|uniref:Neuropeptide Y n=1 Tax=Elysia marginata TaxID=1093978 RepID=A0AAV4EG93_9GAST|nr:neuropeptide Y [Elysia marginata]
MSLSPALTTTVSTELHDGMIRAVMQGPNGSAPADSPAVTDETNPRLVNGVIVLVLLLLNIMGNSLVCYIYHFKIKPSVFSLFVTILAALDLSTALSTMLMDVMLKMRRETEDVLNLTAMCKLSHFQVYGSSLVGGCVFVLIAYQRYRKICHPLKPSLNMRKARLYIAVIGLACTVLSVPTLIINGPLQIRVVVHGHEVLTTVCRYDAEFKGTIVQMSFSYLLLSAFVLMISTTVSFYILIFRALRSFERGSSVYSHGAPASPGTPLPEIGSVHSRDSATPQQANGSMEAAGFSPRSPPHKGQGPQWPRSGSMSVIKKPRGSRAQQPRFSVVTMTEGRGERVSSQMHRVFTVVTAVFVISYLPHLVVLILNKSLKLDERALTWGQRFALEAAYNCPYISTVANPFVYGFRSTEFRRQCKRTLLCKGDKRARGRGKR